MTRTPLNIAALAARIRALQDADGRITWIEQGLFDPWNHCEAAMGLAVAGDLEAALLALDHLADVQRADGSWVADMGCAAAMDADNRRLVADGAPQVIDVNFCAYPATAVWHAFLASGDAAVLGRYAAMVERAIGFVLDLQKGGGAFPWRAPEVGENASSVEALVAGTASVAKSLECAVRIADALAAPSSLLRNARQRAIAALCESPDAFTAKPNHAMDWYYPVLAGVLDQASARARLAARWDEFVEPEWGCRCVSDEPWATAAETAELAIAAMAVGQEKSARSLLARLAAMTSPEGDLWMGRQFALDIPWPEERPSWTAGAALLACDAVYGLSSASRLFLEPLDAAATVSSRV